MTLVPSVLPQTPAPELAQSRARPLLGTLVEISVGGLAPEPGHAAIARAYAVIEEVHGLMSYQSPDSEVSRLNRLAGSQPQSVSAHTWRVLQAAQDLARVSEGLFDITVAPTLAALGYLPRHPGCPRADARANWRDVQLLEGRRVHFRRHLRIDLSGIAKGYAVDQAIEVLREAGAGWARVNAGGDLRLYGTQARSIRVRHPLAPGLTLPLFRLAEGAVATSANYFSRRLHRGRVVSPLIHPATGVASAAEQSVTVIAADCMTADALTKVVHADAPASLAVLRHFKAEALWLSADASNGTCRVIDTRDMPAPAAVPAVC